MGQIAYGIAGAAQAAGVAEHVIIRAVKDRHLVARRVDGDKAIILGSDIQAWVESLPDFRATL